MSYPPYGAPGGYPPPGQPGYPVIWCLRSCFMIILWIYYTADSSVIKLIFSQSLIDWLIWSIDRSIDPFFHSFIGFDYILLLFKPLIIWLLIVWVCVLPQPYYITVCNCVLFSWPRDLCCVVAWAHRDARSKSASVSRSGPTWRLPTSWREHFFAIVMLIRNHIYVIEATDIISVASLKLTVYHQLSTYCIFTLFYIRLLHNVVRQLYNTSQGWGLRGLS